MFPHHGAAMPIRLPDTRSLSDETIDALRLRAIHGLELGHTGLELAAILGVAPQTVSEWWTAYKTGGVDALPGDRTGRPLGSGRDLTDEQGHRICRLIDSRTPEQLGLPHAMWTRRAVADLVRKEFTVDIAERTAGEYLKRWGYTAKKPERHSRKQDPEAVAEWVADTYQAIEEYAAQEHADILWIDEVGVVADQCSGYAYAFEGERAVMDVPRPHIRVNQVTAIGNDGTVHSMTYTIGMNHELYLSFLKQVVEDSPRKVIVIADRLPAHLKPAVMEWVEANEDEIEVFFLPTYSPELNPVEYLNNDLKGEINKNGMPDDKDGLREKIAEFMHGLIEFPYRVASYFLHPKVEYAAGL
jgi:transposase